jgi:hypothetical protein
MLTKSAYAQPPAPTPDWYSFLPELSDCTKEAPVTAHDPLAGWAMQSVRYVHPIAADPPHLKPGEVWVVSEQTSRPECGTFSLQLTVPAIEEVLTKEEQKKQQALARRIRKSQKKWEALERAARNFGPQRPPPRNFVISGYPAVRQFPVPCDYNPCESDDEITILVALSLDKKLWFRTWGDFEEKKRLLERIDLKGLISAASRYAASRTKMVSPDK